jgi:uncharacterized protein YlxW (UPF0749 family)
MNPFEFVLAILLMVFVFSIIKHKMGIPSRSMREMRGDPMVDTQETARLRDEVRELKERIKVLERITVEKENSLAKEIESLRDR